ncbi:unnamed protein product [Timema podura]|uniref:Malonyl-CoA:ACP transacylase (MAT) domain-containing protein n=1 Tax=Timema podura TaxID=61482 RepID=A0ABN7P1Q1_TIMPD|nr:unnamed protein product [Timema podura]
MQVSEYWKWFFRPVLDKSMHIVSLGYKDVKELCPPEIDVACHNSSNSSTISGPEEIVKTFVEQLKKENIFARAVNVANIAYHSRYIKPAAPKLLEYLKKVSQILTESTECGGGRERAELKQSLYSLT